MTKASKGESVRVLATALRDLLEGAKPYEVEAQKLGAKAHKSGVKRSPALDPGLNKLLSTLKGFTDGSKEQTNAMKAWLRGWDSENLKD